MIAVIADDFTGAAEIGGIGLRHGLKVIIETEVNNPTGFDLLVIATDTRSMSPQEASDVTRKITSEVLKLKPEFIFKKIDSTLRGNIAEELNALMETANINKTLLIAANPIFQRIIRDGIYTIDNVPLHKTHFASDPEFPISTSSIKKILETSSIDIITGLTPFDHIPENGIIAGDVRNFGDLEAWASLSANDILIAGASGFFNALLQQRQLKNVMVVNDIKPSGNRELFVLGSTFNQNKPFLNEIEKRGFLVCNMPEQIYTDKNYSKTLLDKWVDQICNGLQSHTKVFASVMYPISNEPGVASRIKEAVGEVVSKTSRMFSNCDLIIEGGGTTSVILKHLGIKKLFPIEEIETGIIRMKIKDNSSSWIITKPGSYQWPESFLEPEQQNMLN